MDTASEMIPAAVAERAAPEAPTPLGARRRGLGRFRVAITVYLATRVALLVLALVEHEVRHQPVLYELANWDGRWFRALALHGYPAHVAHAQTTLGFMPLYAVAMWLVAHLAGTGSITGLTVAGLVISGIGGLVTAVLVQELAAGWWGEATGRRAAVLYCLFPGSVVFSMVYAKGILIPIAAGCILGLERRRWVLAAVLAGIATATEPRRSC